MDEKNGGPLSVLHVSKRGIFRFGFQNLGETLLGVLLGHRYIDKRVVRGPISEYRHAAPIKQTRFVSPSLLGLLSGLGCQALFFILAAPGSS